MTDTNGEYKLAPSNHKPILPSQSFSSWGDAFKSAAEIKPHDLGDYKETFEDPSQPKFGAGNVSGISAIAQEALEASKKRKAAEVQVEVDVKPSKKSKKDKAKDKKSKKKKDKKDKKSKRDDLEKVKPSEESNCNGEGVPTTASSSPPTSKKKSKKEKKKKKDKKATISTQVPTEEVKNVEPTETTSTPASSPLEGQMVTQNGESIFVLVDKSNDAVYSMERSDNGDLVQIGNVISGEIRITGKHFHHVSHCTTATAFATPLSFE